MTFTPGERVEVHWHRRGWLAGTYERAQPSPLMGEDFARHYVKMDNGLPCAVPGYHPDCVRKMGTAAQNTV